MRALRFGIQQVIADGEVLHPQHAAALWQRAQKEYVALLNGTMLELLRNGTPPEGVKLSTYTYRLCRTIPTPLINRYLCLAAKKVFQHYRTWLKQRHLARPPFFKASHPLEIDDGCGLRIDSVNGKVRFLLGRKGSDLPREIVCVVNLSDKKQRRAWELLTTQWTIKQVHIHQNERGRWGLRFVYDAPPKSTESGGDEVVGVDIGLKHFLVADTFPPQDKPFVIDGDFFIGRWWAFRDKLRRWQRAARRIADGHGRAPIVRLLRRVKGKMQAWRRTVIYQIANALVRWAQGVGAGTLVVEDLTGLRDDRLDHPLLTVFPYFQFRQQLEYVAQREGLAVVYVDPYKTSSLCARCKAEVRQHDDRTIECPACGHKADRDRNAAQLLARLVKEGEGQAVALPSWLQRKRATRGRQQRRAKKERF